MLSARERFILLDNPDYFCLKYFAHKLRANPRSEPSLKDFHVELIETACTSSRGLVLYPAGHGKTSLVSTMLPIWGLCDNPNIRMAIIAKNDQDANNIGLAIQAELLGNEQLIADFGPFLPDTGDKKPFSAKNMSVLKRTKIAKEPTIALFGAGSRNALGHRTDWLICDDIVHDQNAGTPERREKLREWFNQGPATSGEFLSSRLTVVGTMFDPADLYHDLIELGTYDVKKIDAIVDEEAETTLWVERWPWLRLMERKAEMGTLDFNKRYRNIAVDKSRMAFKEAWIKGGYEKGVHFKGCLDRNYKVGDYEESWWRYAAFDPAIGVTKSRKFCAHIVLAVGSCKEHERCFWVVDLEREQLTLPQQVDLIISKHEEYNIFQSVVETNAYQAGLHQSIETRLKDAGKALKIDPHYTTRTNKPDPEMGVLGMARYFENGMWHIPYADEYSRRKMSHFIDELVMYPGRFTDTVMAAWMAWRPAQEGQRAMGTGNYLKALAPKMYRSTRRRPVLNPHYVRN